MVKGHSAREDRSPGDSEGLVVLRDSKTSSGRLGEVGASKIPSVTSSTSSRKCLAMMDEVDREVRLSSKERGRTSC